MRPRRVLSLTLLAFVVAAPALAQYPGRPRTWDPFSPTRPAAPEPGKQAAPGPPALRLGAILPLSGPGRWFGNEILHGMELAIAELKGPGGQSAGERRAAPPGAPATTGEGQIGREPAATAGAGTSTEATTGGEPRPGDDRPSAAGESRGSPGPLALETADVPPLDAKRAAHEFNRLAALGVPVVFTASATPTLAIHALAAVRDVLIVHQGALTPRLPTASRTLLHVRPPLAARLDALLGYAREQNVRRLAVYTGGDDFGKAVRAGASARWRERGGTLVLDESLTLDAPDLPARVRQLRRLTPDAVLLGFQGTDLGDLAARLREGGYAGPLYLADDDPTARLAGGPAVDGAVVVSEAFVPEPGSPGEQFAAAYTKRFGAAPSRHAAQAYDAVMMLAAGARTLTAEGRPPIRGGRLRDALVAAGSFPSVFGGRAVLQDDGTVVRPLALFTVRGSALELVRHVVPPARS